ncbi:MAG TPA: ABC transporter permease [Candidatus Cloacimonadota bacterium]|nr:ABC transporter permease [Candidatus Cloacimonadota bacterium]
MLKLFIIHEMKSLLKTRKVIWSLLLFLTLFSIFFYIRLDDFQKRMNNYIQDVEQTEKQLSEATNYSFLNPRAIRKPKLFSIYHEGNTHTYGNVINVEFFEPILESALMNTEYNLYFKDYPQIDITYLVTFFLSLFILLISYDCINREKANGTLRIVMTWPFKRNLYLLKKLIGIFTFVSIVFSLPFFLSFIALIILYGSMISSGFITSYIVYWIMVLLYIMIISCIGVLISILTHKPGKSLVLALFLWTFFCIINPVLWRFVHDYLPRKQAEKIHKELDVVTGNLFSFNYPDSLNLNNMSHYNWNSNGKNAYVTVFGPSSTMKAHREYNRFTMKNYMPLVYKREELYTLYDIANKRYNESSHYFMFFNPNEVLDNTASIIGGSSQADQNQFIEDARSVRNSFLDQGVRDGWLYSNEYFAWYDANVEPDDLPKLGLDLQSLTSWDQFYVFMESKVGFYKMKVPQMKRYQQREVQLTEIFPKIVPSLIIMITLICGLLYFLKIKFDAYDIR